ncbi:MAG: hypothetical protein KF884_09375 [Fimbriimonadaceae bacterium]|nr:hypothetical protein [Fimbriimonadaceae bacterium]QYK57756.1 MAG: hypothetical protein KF884_09375 [Fimbriimonadaceae bacterium]
MIKQNVIVACVAFVVTSARGNVKPTEDYSLIATFLEPKSGRINGLEEISRTTRHGVDLNYRRVTDDARLTIRFGIALDDDPDRELNFRLATMGARDSLTEKLTTWSGFPMGELGVVRGGRVSVAGCMFGRSEIHVKWNLPKGAPDAPEEELEAIEGIVRWGVARIEGSKLGSEESLTVRGKRLPCRRAPSGLILVDVEAWCQAQDLTVAKNDVLGTISFVRSDRRTIVPLGSYAFKTGSNWWQSSYVNCVRNGRWFVPLDALEERT